MLFSIATRGRSRETESANMNPIISIMAQGAMGAATASRLVENGLEVRTDLTGRSAASAERAAKAGMKAVSEDELAGADFLLSIVPPADAVSLAERLSTTLARAAHKPIYVDFNAVNPQTTKKVAKIVQAAGARFVLRRARYANRWTSTRRRCFCTGPTSLRASTVRVVHGPTTSTPRPFSSARMGRRQLPGKPLRSA